MNALMDETNILSGLVGKNSFFYRKICLCTVPCIFICCLVVATEFAGICKIFKIIGKLEHGLQCAIHKDKILQSVFYGCIYTSSITMDIPECGNEAERAYKRMMAENELQRQTAQKLLRKLDQADNIQVSGGPFHYHMRAGTYGEMYDEPAWKFFYGIGQAKDRSGCESNPLQNRYYDKRILVSNWVEEQRDRNYIKYDNSPKLSQYGHMYRSEYSRSFSKPLCNRARDVLLKIKSFPLTAHPAHQPELEVNTIRCSAPKPQSCIDDEETVKCRKKEEAEKRYAKHARELSGES